MLQLTPHNRFFLGIEPVDFRKGIDGIAAYCKQKLYNDPTSGAWFVFRNRAKTAIKLLVYDGQGYWLCMKRFSKGRLAWWPSAATESEVISAQYLHIILYQGDPTLTQIPPDWKPLN